MINKPIKALIIDLDDTLIAFDVVTIPSWKQVCADYCRGRDLDCETLYETIMKENRWYWSDPERHRIGRQNNPLTRRRILEKAFRENDLGSTAEAHGLADDYTRVRTENQFLFPDAKEILTRLKADGHLLIMMTNGDEPTQRSKIERFGLAPYFDKILIEGELGFGKPDPRVFQLAFDFASAAPEETVIVGDNLRWEIGVPNTLGMGTVWMNYNGRKKRKDSDPRPDVEIRRLEELPGALLHFGK